MARQFGIISVKGDAITGCVVNSFKRGSTAQWADAKNEAGKTTDKWAYSREETVSIGGVLDSEKMTLKGGEILTIGEEKFGINTVSQDETNSGAATFSVDAANSDGAEIHAYTPAASGGA